MGTQVDHLEVAPRMWDKTLAASYMPNIMPARGDPSVAPARGDPSVVPTDADVTARASNVSTAPTHSKSYSSFARFRAYAIPAIFLICLLIVAYILWKYFTKYRNSKMANGECPAMNCSKTESNLKDPLTLIRSGDMSKYELDSDDDEDDGNKHITNTSRLPTLLESKESDAEESVEADEAEESAEEETDDNTDDNSEEKDMDSEAPDIAQIERLIMNSGTDGSDDDTFSLRMPSYITEITDDSEDLVDLGEDIKSMKRQPREPRKTKRVTL